MVERLGSRTGSPSSIGEPPTRMNPARLPPEGGRTCDVRIESSLLGACQARTSTVMRGMRPKMRVQASGVAMALHALRVARHAAQGSR